MTGVSEIIRTDQLGHHAGRTVTVRGWLTHLRRHAAVAFLTVRDGRGEIQAVARPQALAEEAWQALDALAQETALSLTGTVRADPRAPGGYELALTDLKILGQSQGYPITPKEHGVDFLLDHRHLWLRSPRQAAILRIRDRVEAAIEEFLRGEGFVRVDAPILMSTAAESTTDLFRTDYLGEPAYLSQSGQLYAEAAIFSLERVYTFGPTFRAERSKTRRHLLEFWMVEPEMAHMDLEAAMELEERLIVHVVGRILERSRADLEVLGRPLEPLRRVAAPFARLTFDEAAALLASHGAPLAPGEDFGAPHETLLGELMERPVFVHRFPAELKPFYMEPDPERPDRVLAADLIAPEGYGEIIGGSQRISDLTLLERRMAEAGLDPEAYAWYADLRRYGSVVHSGFGLGLERLVSWLAGLSHVREAIPFPRLYNRLRP